MMTNCLSGPKNSPASSLFLITGPVLDWFMVCHWKVPWVVWRKEGHWGHAGDAVSLCMVSSPLLKHICNLSNAIQPVPCPPPRASCEAPGTLCVPTWGEYMVLSPLGFASKQQSWASCFRRSVTSSPTGSIFSHQLWNRQQPAASCRGLRSPVKAEKYKH